MLTLPQLGNQRQKQARSRVAQMLAQQIAQSKGINRFAKLGVGKGGRFANPFVSSAGKFAQQRGGLPRPDMLSNRGVGQRGFSLMQQDAPDIHVNPPAALPSEYLVPDAPSGPPPGGFGGGRGLGGGGGGGSYFDPNIPVGQPGGQTHGDAVEGNVENIWGFNQPSPSAPVGIGGFVPLGGGLFLNPATGEVRGAGGRATLA